MESAVSAPGAEPGFAHAVIDWQRLHGRHSLPWQGSRDPYRIWLSEVMLQQTQVSAVIPYYTRFLEHFPDVLSLANAPQSEVMALWSGLGYYSRARNLHRCAQIVRDAHDGKFPASAAALAELPGIGRSTAAAIAAFAYGERAAILDGNVKRVLCRVFGIEGWPGTRVVEQDLWRRADALLPEESMHGSMQSYTQGLMDLGAGLCTRGQPGCEACPLAQRCVAFATGRAAQLPTPRPKKTNPHRTAHMLLLTHGEQVLLEQRGPSGIWGGLLSLPELAASEPGEQDVKQIAADYGLVRELRPLPVVTHVFTHFTLHFTPWLVQLEQRFDMCGETTLQWTAMTKLRQAALPAPVKKLLVGLFAGEDLLSAAALR
jgi:A/G-specific adenine glycosylase